MAKRKIFIGDSYIEVYEIKELLKAVRIPFQVQSVGNQGKVVTPRSRFVRNARSAAKAHQLIEIKVDEKDYRQACYLMLKYRNSKNT